MSAMSESDLRQILEKALAQSVARSGKDEVYAASLASKITAILREKRADPWASFTASEYGDLVKQKGVECGLKGPRFREFLLCFPDLVTVKPTESGDLVQWLEAENIISQLQEHRGKLVATALQTLAQLKDAGQTVVSASKLALNMKGAVSDSMLKSLGYDSFMGFLSRIEGVEVDRKTPGGKVWLKSQDNEDAPVETGFLLVDGEDIWRTLDRLLGRAPEEDQRPDWGQIADWVKENFPAGEWKRPYLLRGTSAEQIKLFIQALGRIGYRPLIPPIPDGVEPANMWQVERKAVLAYAAKIIHSAFTEKCRLVVVSHDEEILRCVLEKGKYSVTPVILAFPEFLPDFVQQDRRLKVIDLEMQVHAFTSALPRRITVPLEDFDPMRDL